MVRGNLIVVPVQNSIIYLEPIYLQSTGSAIPEFTKVVLASPTKVVWADTLKEALTALLDPQIEFRGLTPSRGWEASSPDGVREIVFGSWFEPQDHVRETIEADAERVADRDRLRYRLRVESEGIEYLDEPDVLGFPTLARRAVTLPRNDARGSRRR